VLVPYLYALPGGVRRVLGEGLPRLEGCDVRYVELGRNQADMDEMEAAGVAVDRVSGVAGPGILSERSGLGRAADLARAAPRLLRIALRLRRALRNADVAYVHGFRELLLVAIALAATSAARRPAVVWHCHGEVAGRKAALTRPLAARCHRVIAVSDHIARVLVASGIPAAKIVRIPNAVPQAGPLPRPRAWRGGERPLLVASATLRMEKGAGTAIDALGLLPDDFVLWVTGDQADLAARSCAVELQRHAERIGVASRVKFLGQLSDVPAAMRDAFAVLCPSLVPEGFGLAAVEPMTVGAPVVVSDRGALPEVAGHGRAGLVFTAGDAAALAREVRRLEDAELRAAIVARAHEHARTRFGFERWVEEVQGVLRDARRDRERGRGLS
jgi:glycosyltransferase involved in cell wall biosynthesis